MKKQFLEMIEKEYQAFRTAELALPQEKMFCDALQIYFFNEIHDYFNNCEIDNDTCEVLFEEGCGLIHRLWYKFLKWEHVSVNSYNDVEDLIHEYVAYISRGL